MIRSAREADLPAIRRIQELCPEAAQWSPGEYPAIVAAPDDEVRGFLFYRELPYGEFEILNLAVHPDWRRQGLGLGLVLELIRNSPKAIYLEVRESNTAALALYLSAGFTEISRRAGYYRNPPEGAVVMKWSSC
jgi:ribosomal-protein-alanine N-acetyltransferase